MCTNGCDECLRDFELTEFKCPNCRHSFLYCKYCIRLVSNCKTCFDCMSNTAVKTKSKKFTDRRSI
jgi:hypothetical protein